MLFCNKCGGRIILDYQPGALMFGHLDSIGETSVVWKAHICQSCEKEIVETFKFNPIPQNNENRKNSDV